MCFELRWDSFCRLMPKEMSVLPVPHVTGSVCLDSFPTRQTSGEDFQVPFLREKPGWAVCLNIKRQVRQTELHGGESKMQSQEKASGPQTRQEDSGKWIQAEGAQKTKFWCPKCWWKKKYPFIYLFKTFFYLFHAFVEGWSVHLALYACGSQRATCI